MCRFIFFFFLKVLCTIPQEILKLSSDRHEQHVASPPNDHQFSNPNLVSTDDDGGKSSANAQEQQQQFGDEKFQRSSEPNPNPSQPESEVDALQQRQLLSKVIELENKANINAKREVILVHALFDLSVRIY